VAVLGDVVVEGEDWAGEVEGCVEDVGDVVAEAEVVGAGRGVDSLALGVAGGIDVLLLKRVSFCFRVRFYIAVSLPQGLRLSDRDSSSSRS
jgi:hypothetical protein